MSPLSVSEPPHNGFGSRRNLKPGRLIQRFFLRKGHTLKHNLIPDSQHGVKVFFFEGATGQIHDSTFSFLQRATWVDDALILGAAKAQ